MADFSHSGIPGLPQTTADTLLRADTRDGAVGDPRTLGWLRECVQEGDRINQSDPSYDRAAQGMEYIVGDQRSRSSASAQLKYLPQMTVNESRKVTQAHASVLTDLKPVWSYKTENPAFQQHGYLLNNLIIAWYVNTMADLELGNTVKLALGGGTADTICEWDPHARFGGDHRIMARDFRDTLPWRPAPMSRSEQDWQGVTFREEHTMNVLRGMYPTKANLFIPTTDSLLSTLMGRFRALASKLISPAADTLAGLGTAGASLKPKSGHVLLYKTFLDDHTINLTAKTLIMGPPGASWAYPVKPFDRVYPNKRLIISTPEAVIWDGPSPFWHGMFPFSRLKLWDVPWQFLGVSLLHDLIPVQDGINDSVNDIRLAIKQWMDQTTVYDRQSVSESFMRLFDPRRPGAKVKTNAGRSEGFKKLDGPNPQVVALAIDFWKLLTDKFGDLSGVANLQRLLELRQMPGADTIRQYYEAMTPELRSEGRQMEAYLRPLAEMLKVNTFQYQSKAKRIALLGDAGITLEDFDFDPESLVPAMEPGSPGYTPELDASLPRAERAQFFHKMIVFRVAPNSILAMNAAEQKMLRVQLSRQGYFDFWSLLESLEIPNVGQPPAIPLPPLKPPTPEELQASLGDPALGIPGDGRFIPDPMTGQVLEMRVPLTITERLQAQQLLGIGQSVDPAGRKASGQQSPQQDTKTDGDGTSRPSVKEAPE